MLVAYGGHNPLNLAILPGERSRCASGGLVGCEGFLVLKGRCWWRRAGQRAADGEAPRSLVVARVRLSNFFSRIGLDSQTFQSKNMSQLLWVGPVPGDIAKVEAYCRIFRAAEQLHTTIMDTLCNPETGECSVNYDTPFEDRSLLEEKVVAILGCMLALLNKGREDVLDPLRRSVVEAQSPARILLENNSFVLAAERTHRKDPLNDYKIYNGGWNISDRHYWASVGLSAASFFSIAAA